MVAGRLERRSAVTARVTSDRERAPMSRDDAAFSISESMPIEVEVAVRKGDGVVVVVAHRVPASGGASREGPLRR